MLKFQSSNENDWWVFENTSGNSFSAFRLSVFLLWQPYINTFFFRECPCTSINMKMFLLVKVLFSICFV